MGDLTVASGHSWRRFFTPARIAGAVALLALAFFAVNAFGGTPTMTCALNGFTDANGVTVTKITEGDTVTITATFTTDGADPLPAGSFSFWNGDTGVQIAGTQAVTHAATTTGTTTYTVTDTTASLQHGTYAVWAAFLPGINAVDQYGTCTTGRQTLAVAPKQGTHTTTTVEPQSATANVGDPITFTAHIAQDGAPLAPVGGNVIFHANPGTDLAAPVTVHDNIASLSLTIGLRAGTYEIQALYSGDYTENLDGSSGTATLTVHDTSSLTYKGDATVRAGQRAVLGGTLVDSLGRAISGRDVTFAVTGTGASCDAKTDANGEASCPAIVDAAPGTYAVTASFAGDAFLSGSSGNGSIEVERGPTHLTYAGPPTAIVGRMVSLSATLTNDSGKPVAGATVVFSIGGNPSETCRAITDAHGVGSCDVRVTIGAGTYTVTASYDGSLPQYTARSDSGPIVVVVTVPTTLTYQGPTSAAPGTPVSLSFLLTDDQHQPLKWMPVTIAGQSASTGGDGIATVTKTFSLGGDYTITATFDRTDPYLASRATPTIHVDPAPTLLVLSAPPIVQIGQPLTITATLTTSTDHVAVSGKTVTLMVDGQPCTKTTDTAGTITCTSTAAAPARRAVITADFAGDAQALSSHASGSTIVYGLAPGGGMFVVGSATATGSVTFWGAQWAKLNPLAKGSPDAFKGFADAAMPQCGATWTTRPGNSTPPPAGPLPAYMAVVVSSSISKSGSAITGDVKRVVVVATSPGYASDPGHAGTGTVVAPVCATG